MFSTLGIKTDYSLLKSLIKQEDLFSYVTKYNLNCLGILDDNLSGSYEFYTRCIKNKIKPVIGLITFVDNNKIYLYAKSYKGLSNMFRYSKYILDKEIDYDDFNLFSDEVILVLPSESYKLLSKFNRIFKDIFLSYSNSDEKNIAGKLSTNLVFIKEICCLKEEDAKYLNYLDLIKMGGVLGDIEFSDKKEYIFRIEEEDISSFVNLINIRFDSSSRFIPHFDNNIEDSSDYLVNLANKGLRKRLNNNVSDVYQKRLNYELSVIDSMGFTDYFLIVFDYVRYAIKNDIYVGVGRGSAAGSLVSYALGITWIDPIKYDLLFERFLNPERVTMPDIDVDFEDSKREMVVHYVKSRYGEDKVGHILAYGTMTAREVIRTVGKIDKVDERLLDNFCKKLDSKLSLKENNNEEVRKSLSNNSLLNKVYNEALHLEGLKKHIGTHAAGIVISSVPLDTVVPMIKNGDEVLIGYDKDELEPLGLIKMDFLSIEKLTIMTNIVNDVKKIKNVNFNINMINLDDDNVFNLFREGNTQGIFQFESLGIRNFLKRMKPKCFDDIYLASALYRPGASASLDEYLDRRMGKSKITYPDERLKDILESTCGILVYQEQVMKILNVMASYSYAEADIIRRAISKKKNEIIESNKSMFIERAIKNNYSKECAEEVYDLIVNFASFGFNKSHAVAYAMISYQMAFLKTYFEDIYYVNLLNANSGEAKNKEYINECKGLGIKFLNPDINKSLDKYYVDNKNIRIPFRAVKGLSSNIINLIINERNNNGDYKDFYDFIVRCYGKEIKKNNLELLIYAGVFDSFKINRATLIKNLDAVIMYGDLVKSLGTSLVNEPEIKEELEFSDNEILNKELELFGYYFSNHPASKYPEVMKLKDISKFFNKFIDTVVLVERIKMLKTKNNDDMAFITGSDDTGEGDLTVFPSAINELIDVKIGDLVRVKGRVERRNDKYQIIVNKISKL